LGIVIQKFGGTSLSTPQQRERVCQAIQRERHKGNSVVVVVSAMGRADEPYATDTLISLLRRDNLNPNRRELDMLMSCGEIISGVVLTNKLQSHGEQAVFLNGVQAGIKTNSNHGDARIVAIDTRLIKRYLDEDYVVVVAGFQGISEDGEITTLGRGGSDVTASALGVALGADVIDIYTDVEGIMTADPRIVKNARLLDAVTYNEICQLAREGAKVIHPRAVEIAMESNIPLRVRSTFSESTGTLVGNYGEFNGESVQISRDRLITGITQMPDITQIRVDIQGEAGLPLRVFKAMALAEISVDFITVTREVVIFTVLKEVAERAREILENLGLSVVTEPDCAKVAIVGAAITGIPGVMAKVVEALTLNGIEILQSGDSYTNIWCLVKRDQMELAVKALHDKFELGNQEGGEF